MKQVTITEISLSDLREVIREELGNYSLNCSKITNTLNAADELLTIKQVADLLQVTVPTVYNYVCDRKIPFYRHQKLLYFFKQEILDFIKKTRNSTYDEMIAYATSYHNAKRKA